MKGAGSLILLKRPSDSVCCAIEFVSANQFVIIRNYAEILFCDQVYKFSEDTTQDRELNVKC